MTVAAVHDHQCCIDKALACADNLCAQRDVRFTPIRRRVLELIWRSHEAVKAYDLLDQLRSFEAAAKPATVYRALDFLLEQGLIHRVESLNAFIGCNHAEQRHELLLLLCERCHRVEELTAPAVMEALAQELAEANFAASHKALEIHGLCRHCAMAA
ncbi:transcriptional repressor [Methylogaea oryzae]|uniref:Transcriptional repressor n=1 Tax=Methylogaea oryzae TaxID=1295382 RepID=A0A8D4VMW1_9GAMM|nr:transcriptional repressor [Methylogaea oryzae]BBL69477.1 transcriptional repressor [Methylogaea oryzae]